MEASIDGVSNVVITGADLLDFLSAHHIGSSGGCVKLIFLSTVWHDFSYPVW